MRRESDMPTPIDPGMTFRSEFLSRSASGLRRRPDYGHKKADEEQLYHLRNALGEAKQALRRAGSYSGTEPWIERLRQCWDILEEVYGEVDNAIPYRSPAAGPIASKEAGPDNPRDKQAGQAPRSYRVGQEKDGLWYIFGLPGQEIAEGSDEAVQTPDTWLNVHRRARNLDLAEQLYRELYAEFQANDNLREGDTFDTPIGTFACQGVDVIPYDDAARKAVAEVDESYKCGNCGCDQGEHRKKVDDNGYPCYGECSNHSECKEYTRKGL